MRARRAARARPGRRPGLPPLPAHATRSRTNEAACQRHLHPASAPSGYTSEPGQHDQTTGNTRDPGQQQPRRSRRADAARKQPAALNLKPWPTLPPNSRSRVGRAAGICTIPIGRGRRTGRQKKRRKRICNDQCSRDAAGYRPGFPADRSAQEIAAAPYLDGTELSSCDVTAERRPGHPPAKNCREVRDCR